ncbi:MAG: hypothetical protein ACRDYZ_11205 [Acidimicrobiales bacterium]
MRCPGPVEHGEGTGHLHGTDAARHDDVGAADAASDPVCGMAVDPESAPASRYHDGEHTWFCSTGCARRRDERGPAVVERRARTD